MSPPNFAVTWYVAGFPRVSGDEPSTARALVMVLTFSPRERG